jgi:hypothetical protein
VTNYYSQLNLNFLCSCANFYNFHCAFEFEMKVKILIYDKMIINVYRFGLISLMFILNFIKFVTNNYFLSTPNSLIICNLDLALKYLCLWRINWLFIKDCVILNYRSFCVKDWSNGWKPFTKAKIINLSLSNHEIDVFESYDSVN